METIKPAGRLYIEEMIAPDLVPCYIEHANGEKIPAFFRTKDLKAAMDRAALPGFKSLFEDPD